MNNHRVTSVRADAVPYTEGHIRNTTPKFPCTECPNNIHVYVKKTSPLTRLALHFLTDDKPRQKVQSRWRARSTRLPFHYYWHPESGFWKLILHGARDKRQVFLFSVRRSNAARRLDEPVSSKGNWSPNDGLELKGMVVFRSNLSIWIQTECNRHYLWINSRHTVQRRLYLLIHKMQMVPPKMTHFSANFNMIRTKLMCNTYTSRLHTT